MKTKQCVHTFAGHYHICQSDSHNIHVERLLVTLHCLHPTVRLVLDELGAVVFSPNHASHVPSYTMNALLCTLAVDLFVL